MDRRTALQLLATGTALQLHPAKMLTALREARSLLGKQTELRTLSPHQNATVTSIAETIIPRTETPGAADVGVSEFVDLILTEWYTEPERAIFLSGLADLEVRTQSLFKKNFVQCSLGERSQILRELGKQMMAESEALEGHGYRGAARPPDKNFYYMMRSLTLTAYYTSEAGATKELMFQVIPDHPSACAPVRGGGSR